MCLLLTKRSATTPCAGPPPWNSTRACRLPVGSSTIWTVFVSPGFSVSPTTPLKPVTASVARTVNVLAGTSTNVNAPCESVNAKQREAAAGRRAQRVNTSAALAAGVPSALITVPRIWLTPIIVTATPAVSPSNPIWNGVVPTLGLVCDRARTAWRPERHLGEAEAAIRAGGRRDRVAEHSRRGGRARSGCWHLAFRRG